jgi:hypothetical protein
MKDKEIRWSYLYAGLMIVLVVLIGLFSLIKYLYA